MKVLPLDVGPIVGETASTRVRLWGRAAYEATPEGPRRACGVARIRSSKSGGFSDPVFFKMNPSQLYSAQTASGYQRILILANLIPLWYIRIEIIFSIEFSIVGKRSS